jgi:hypothetical protein
MKKLFCLFVVVVAGCGTVPSVPPSASECGSQPVGYETQIRSTIGAGLIDPESARFEFEAPVPAWGPKKEQCWIVKTWCNAKNHFGGYTGRHPYWFYIREGNIVGIARPDMVAVADWGKENPLTWSWLK